MKIKHLAFFGTTLALVLSSRVAFAQSDSTPKPPEELSPEALRSLCEKFPQNSRCQGQGNTTTPSTITPGSTTPSETTTPESTTPSDSLTPSPGTLPETIAPSPSESLTPSDSTPGSMDQPSSDSPSTGSEMMTPKPDQSKPGQP